MTDTDIPCLFCDRRFATYAGLNDHMWACHKEQKLPERVRDPTSNLPAPRPPPTVEGGAALLDPGKLADFLTEHVARTPPDDLGCIAIDTLKMAEWVVIVGALRDAAALAAVAGRQRSLDADRVRLALSEMKAHAPGPRDPWAASPLPGDKSPRGAADGEGERPRPTPEGDPVSGD